MIKKDISFEDFDGNRVTETHYFHLSKSELIQMDGEQEGGLGKVLQQLQDSKDSKEIFRLFTYIIKKSYGRRDANNATRFIKDPQEQKDFLTTMAFEALLSEMLLDGTAAAVFVSGIVPKDLAEMPEVKQAFEEAKQAGAAITNVQLPPAAEQAADDREDEQKRLEENALSGLQHPRGKDGLVPWWNRKPTEKELTQMSHAQLVDVMRRTNSGWTPPVAV